MSNLSYSLDLLFSSSFFDCGVGQRAGKLLSNEVKGSKILCGIKSTRAIVLLTHIKSPIYREI